METAQITTQKFIIKFFPEMMVKGSVAKRQMVGQLYNNLQKLLFRISNDINIRKFSDKIEVVVPVAYIPQSRSILLKTPGVEQVLEALQFDGISTLEEIKTLVNQNVAHTIQNKKFVVRAKRTGCHEFRSFDIEKTVGGYMLAQNPTASVDLHNPEVIVRIEFIHNQLNIVTKKHFGLSGFPIGSQGEILSLMSGGFDSTVASYLTMKRGLKTHFIFFNLGGTAHEIGVKQVALYLWNQFGASHRVSFTTIPFEEVIAEIFRSTNESYMGVTLKRLMLLASEKIAQQMQIDALVTGESVGQVSSQTIRNLSLIDQVSNMLILRPLATMNKPEIMNIAHQIGTKKFAEDMPEYCGVISKNPVIHGSYKRMKEIAKRFDYTVLDKAVSCAKKVFVDQIVDDINTSVAEIEIVEDLLEVDADYVLIDIRQEEETIEACCKTLKIPFYNLKQEFKKLPQDKQYLFYCDKGILSQLHAQYLRDEQNYTNIKVYRPVSK